MNHTTTKMNITTKNTKTTKTTRNHKTRNNYKQTPPPENNPTEQQLTTDHQNNSQSDKLPIWGHKIGPKDPTKIGIMPQNIGGIDMTGQWIDKISGTEIIYASHTSQHLHINRMQCHME